MKGTQSFEIPSWIDRVDRRLESPFLVKRAFCRLASEITKKVSE
jgi:hypothetical protein